MRIVFLVPRVGMSGGNIVVAELARKLIQRGHSVDLVSCAYTETIEIDFPFSVISLEECYQRSYDAAIATFWPTAYLINKVQSGKYFYFIQSLESRFEPRGLSLVRSAAKASYRLGLAPVVIAKWLSSCPELGKIAPVVQYGVDRETFFYEPMPTSPDRPFRVLIEGPVETPLKNTMQSISIARDSDADEVWLLTSSDVAHIDGVDKIFSKKNREEVAAIMRQCDVLLKLSLVEGQPMPPVEMSLSGRPSILSNLEGYNDYLINNESSIILDYPYNDKAVAAINSLKSKRQKAKRLGDNAFRSVGAWPSWAEAAEKLESIIRSQAYNKSDLRIPAFWHVWQAKCIIFGLNSLEFVPRTFIKISTKIAWMVALFRFRPLRRSDFIEK